ncbi:MAG: nucleotidyl transferase AbiEii/AbiGii toxin family protein [Acidobacteria bacterium]|nr:nucleotidyl transferase AbiEii/AbiGii toxin family protein [Acidobacteriota bacterium]
MNATSLDLSGKLPPEQVAVFRLINEVAAREHVQFFVVGAKARDLVLHYAYGIPQRRATNDIDFGLLMSGWSKFDRLKRALVATGKFIAHPRMEHRLLSDEFSAIIDLVPFGEIENPKGVIAWQPDFTTRMSTLGFREAWQTSVRVRLAEDLEVAVASPAGLALLKLVAWDDRHYQRDAQDLGLLLSTYIDAGNAERLYGEQAEHADLLEDPEFDYEHASARILGRDVAAIMSKESRSIIERILAEETNEAGQLRLATEMTGGAHFRGETERALIMLRQLRQGIKDRVTG